MQARHGDGGGLEWIGWKTPLAIETPRDSRSVAAQNTL
jgi:hypothetical protein